MIDSYNIYSVSLEDGNQQQSQNSPNPAKEENTGNQATNRTSCGKRQFKSKVSNTDL